jgi:hypothetical protein
MMTSTPVSYKVLRGVVVFEMRGKVLGSVGYHTKHCAV